jgi:hypothetical protein
MRIRSYTVLLIMMAIYLIIAAGTEIFITDYIKPRRLFTYFVLGTLLSGMASLMVNIDVPS